MKLQYLCVSTYICSSHKVISNRNTFDMEYKLDTNFTNTNTYVCTYSKLNNTALSLNIHPVAKQKFQKLNISSCCCINIATRANRLNIILSCLNR